MSNGRSPLSGPERAGTRREMKLRAALGESLIYTRGTVPETGVAWTTALEIAESLDDVEYRLRSLRGVWFFHISTSRHRVALALAERFCTLAANRPDPNDRLVGERLLGVTQYSLGDLPGARRHLERVLADYVTSDDKHIIRLQIDLRAGARMFLARILGCRAFRIRRGARQKAASRTPARPIT